jgi:hypothetical protein
MLLSVSRTLPAHGTQTQKIPKNGSTVCKSKINQRMMESEEIISNVDQWMHWVTSQSPIIIVAEDGTRKKTFPENMLTRAMARDNECCCALYWIGIPSSKTAAINILSSRKSFSCHNRNTFRTFQTKQHKQQTYPWSVHSWCCRARLL